MICPFPPSPQVGHAGWVAVFLMISLIPVQVYIARTIGSAKATMLAHTDERVKLTSEIIGVRPISRHEITMLPCSFMLFLSLVLPGDSSHQVLCLGAPDEEKGGSESTGGDTVPLETATLEGLQSRADSRLVRPSRSLR